MDTILESYNLENLEQMRAIADGLRLRIMDHLTHQPLTVTQLAEVLHEVPSKLHYHVRELERVGLVKLVETREKGGILEKYYRAIAKHINAPATLFRGVPIEEAVATFTEIAQPFFQGIVQAVQDRLHQQTLEDQEHILQFTPAHYWMTAQEWLETNAQIETVLEPYKIRRGLPREQEQTVLLMAYTTSPASSDEEEASTSAKGTPMPVSASLASQPLKRELTFVGGMSHFGRSYLEESLEKGEAQDLYVVGSCTFEEDVTVDLIDRAIASFHLWGKLHASPEVAEALKSKGGERGNKKNTD
jgi:DNA-binding transcriptional ArsR family regulator